MALYVIRQARVSHFSVDLPMRMFARHANANWPVVAIVQANDLEHAFMLSNHIDTDWQDGPGVVWVAEPKEHRSTSVGDVIVDPYGLAYVVDVVGYKLVAHLEPPSVPSPRLEAIALAHDIRRH